MMVPSTSANAGVYDCTEGWALGMVQDRTRISSSQWHSGYFNCIAYDIGNCPDVPGIGSLPSEYLEWAFCYINSR